MNGFLPHRFPSLTQLSGPNGSGGSTSGQWQSTLSDGFKQGMAEGQRRGHELGLAEGRREGMAEGRTEGLRTGTEEGRRKVQASMDTLSRPFEAMLKSIKRLQADYQRAQRDEVVELVAKVAREVIRAELAMQPAQLLALVDEAIAAMPAGKADIEVYLNPEELGRIRDIDPKRVKRWSLIPDPRLEAGECRVKSGHHEVDAGCEQRLGAVMEQVRTKLVDAESDPEPAREPEPDEVAE